MEVTLKTALVRKISPSTLSGRLLGRGERAKSDIREGEIFGLLGPNGAGKTTTISMLSSILQPDGGTITICGIDTLRRSREARRLIGLVPQDIALYPELTARENLSFFGRLHGLSGEASQRPEFCRPFAPSGLKKKPTRRYRPIPAA